MDELNSERLLRGGEVPMKNPASADTAPLLSSRIPDDIDALMALARSAVGLCDVAAIAGDEDE